MTVLFADLVGFTALSEARDPEHVKNLVDGCFERLVADIDAFGGRVDKIIGDAIVALFGAPVAHEDDAERAVRAALRMQQTLADRSEQIGVSIRMRLPASSSAEPLSGSASAFPPRTTRFEPGFPASPPWIPYGPRRRRSARILTAASPSSSTSRTTPQPPGWRPSPPESSRSAYSRTRSG